MSVEILKLPDDLAKQIAAGEVVERPASVVKELIENSIDARASKIEIEFVNGGKSLIKITDNGIAMSPAQAEISLMQYATSKIKTNKDLEAIYTYGFRGEALPSIASVSRFTMRTRQEGQKAVEIYVESGITKHVRDCPMSFGTEIIVQDLFCSVPARRNFLKSEAVEASHIIKICKSYALAHSHISFILKENSKLIFKSVKNLDLLTRVEKIYGKAMSDKIFELKPFTKGVISLRGAILKPQESFGTSRNIMSFINLRPVESKGVFFAFKEAYRQFVPYGRYGAGFIFVDIDPTLIDVNVHPAKREIRFKQENDVRDFLCEAFCESLDNFNKAGLKDYQKAPEQEPQADLLRPAIFPTKLSMLASVKRVEKLDIEEATTPISPSQVELRQSKETLPEPESISSSSPIAELQSTHTIPLFSWRHIASIGNLEIFQYNNSLKILDAKAALKRIIYEDILQALNKSKIEKQILLFPILIECDRQEAQLLQNLLPILDDCGFQIESFSKNAYRIISLPNWMDSTNAQNFVRDILDYAIEGKLNYKKINLSAEIFAKTAIKSVKNLRIEKGETHALKLLEKLFKCQNSSNAPDGSYIIKEIDENSLKKLFL